MKQKTCKICKDKFDPIKFAQNVCGVKCSIIHAKNLKEKRESSIQKSKIGLDIAEEERNINKKLKASLINTKMQIHSIVRDRDKGINCISCNRQWNSDFQAGHFYSANSFHTIKFNLDNIFGQCFYCNNTLEGNVQNYSINLPNRIGIERFNEINRLASIDKKQSKIWGTDSLKECRDMAKKGLIYYHKFQVK